MLLALTMTDTILPTSALAASDPGESDPGNIATDARLLLDTNQDSQYDTILEKGENVSLPETFDTMNARLIVTAKIVDDETAGDRKDHEEHFWSTDTFDFSVNGTSVEGSSIATAINLGDNIDDIDDIATAMLEDSDSNVGQGMYHISRGPAENPSNDADWATPVFIADFKEIYRQDIEDITYEVTQYNTESQKTPVRTQAEDDGELAITVITEVQTQSKITDLKVEPKEGLKAGDEFTVTATSNTSDGRISFTYNGETKTVPVKVKGNDPVYYFAKATFKAVEGSVKVEAYQHGDGLEQSERATIEVTASEADAPQAYTITVAEDSPVEVIMPTNATEADNSISGVEAGTTVQFKVTDPTATEITVMAGNDYVDVTKRTSTVYTFTMPAADVTISAAAPVITKVNTETKIALQGSVLSNNESSFVAGETVEAVIEVTRQDGGAINAPGAQVQVTWPDGTISYVPLSDIGYADATWVVTDAFADSLKDGNKVEIQAQFRGSELYANSVAKPASVTIKSRTLSSDGIALIVTNTDTRSIGSLTVGKPSGIQLNDTVKDKQGNSLTLDTDYTVAYYQSTNGGATWKSVPGDGQVTPTSTNDAFKAVVSPKGDYTQGAFEVVCAVAPEEATPVVTVSVDDGSIMQGQSATLTAEVKVGDTNVAGGTVKFYAVPKTESIVGAAVDYLHRAWVGVQSLFGAGPEDTTLPEGAMYLGEGNVVDGTANFVLTNTAQLEGAYTIYAQYSGYPTMYTTAVSADNATLTVNSATLPSEGWTIGTEGENPSSNLESMEIGEEYELKVYAPNALKHGEDYTTQWYASMDGGLTWVLAGTEKTLTVTPENNLYQYKAVVFPAGDYTEPRNGVSVGTVTTEANAQNDTSIAFTLPAQDNYSVFPGDPIKLQVFVTDTTLTGDDEGAVEVPAVGGTVTFYAGKTELGTVALDGAGYATWDVIGGITETTTFKAEYSGTEQYDGCTTATDNNITVKVKSTELTWADSNDEIQVDGTITAGSVVTLTPPAVAVKGEDNTDLTYGVDYYYQWQYATDYNLSEDGKGTATWLNFSAPEVEGTDHAIRVNVPTENTAFRVLAVPAGNYTQPLPGLESETAVGGSVLKITPYISMAAENANPDRDAGEYFNGDSVKFTVTVKETETGSVFLNEGVVSLKIGSTIVDVEPVLNGTATFVVPVPTENTTYTAVFSATNKYERAQTDGIEITPKTVEIAVNTNGVIKVQTAAGWSASEKLTVNQAYTVRFPIVYAADDAVYAHALTYGTDYRVEWFLDTGNGWNAYDPAKDGMDYDADGYVSGSESVPTFTFTPVNENTRLRAVVYPIGNYMLPEAGIAAGMLTTGEKVATATSIGSNVNADYEGNVITLTATVTAGAEAVLDGTVDFYAGEAYIGTATLNGEGKAIMQYTLPAYVHGANTVTFTAKYTGTTAYEASEDAEGVTVTVQSARISFLNPASMTITIRDGEEAVEQPKVGTSYTLTAPDVYEYGNPAKELVCGAEYFYVWEYSEDGTNWTTVKIGNGPDGQTYTGTFGTDNAEYRATAYPMNPYKYPESGITAKTNTEPQVKDTTTALEIGNAYTKSGDVSIYPVGRKIELKATVTDTAAQAPAAGMVTFYQWQSGVDTTAIGQVYLNPVGEATLTIPAPAEGQFIYFAVFSTNDIYGQSSSVNLATEDDPTTGPQSGTAVNVVVLNNTVKTTNDGELNVAGELQDGKKMVVGQEYTLSGVEGTVDVKKNGLDTYVQAVLAEHKANAANPFYTYQWQKSTDGGNTWTDFQTTTEDSLTITCDSQNEAYRVKIMPYAPSGWTMPVEGAPSQVVGATTTDANAVVSVTDVNNNKIETVSSIAGIQNAGAQDENKTVKVVVNMNSLPTDVQQGGNVTLTTTRGRYDADSSGSGWVQSSVVGETQTQTMDASGVATFEVTLPDYEYKSDSTGANVIRFAVEYAGNDYFTEDNGVAYLRLTPAAITWKMSGNDFTDVDKGITIYHGDTTEPDKVFQSGDSMEANKDYTLAIPAIYSADAPQTELTFGTDFTVQWQRRLTEDGVAWEDIPEGTGETLYLPQGAEGYNYRAVITPTGEYTKAMQDWPTELFTLAIGTVLTTNPTTPTGLTPTTTALEIQNTVKEANSVQVNDAFPFDGEGATGSHDTQYEGEDVKLVATVTEAGGNVQDGYVNFYHYVDGTNDVLLNETPIEIQDGKAELDVTTSAWTDSKGVLENVDRYYAVYEGTNVYEESATIDPVDPLFNQGELKDVYIRSTAIEIPRIGATVGDETKYTTRDADLTDLPAAQKVTFTLVQNNTTAVDGFSVTATDGRWLTAGEDFTMQWYLQGKDVSDGGSSNANEPILGANLVQYIKENASVGEKYSIELIPAGHMQTGATSKQAIIGSASTPLVLLDPGYTFEPTVSDVATDVSTTPGAHYGDEVTLTATVTGNKDTNALPTGTVTFYYRAEGKWIALSEPVNLEQKDVADGKLTAQATYTFNASELPFNVDAICFNYSGDDFYTSYKATETQDANGNKARYYFKLWSTQISNPAREGVTDFGSYTPDYTDAACYPDSQSYGNVEISIYEAQKNGDTFVKGNKLTDDSVQANGDYILELNPVYTKSGEKLEAKLDNAGDISVEWFQSTDGGNTWSPVQVTELSDAEALTVYVKPETKDTKYMVKVTTNNSFYNSAKPELVDYEYSEEYVDVILQQATVAVTAEAETPVNGKSAWVYQRNPITLSATVTPVMQGEPSGYVEFYYTTVDADGIYDDTNTWTQIKDDVTGNMQVALTETDSATDKDGTMVAKLTTSELPVSTNGTYSQLVIKAVYKGDQTFAEANNVDSATTGAEMTGNIASPIVHVFSSTANHNTAIQNKVIATTVDTNGKLTEWGTGGKPTDGAIIFAKNLVSDGTDAVLTLNGVFTRDADDAADAVINNNASIYTMDNETEYTVEWQYCPDYEAYKDYLENPSADDALGAEGKNWKTVEGSTNAMTCNVSMIQAYAFRAKITFNEEPQSMASYTEYKNNLAEPEIDSTKVIYTNILVVGDAEARVFTNIRKASSASKTGDPVSIDVFAMGGSTTPVGSVTVSIYETGAEDAAVAQDAKPVFQQTHNVANGYTVFEWEAKAGIYKIVTKFNGNNGYEGETSEDYIVRFTEPGGELKLSIQNKTVTYNGQVQMMDADDVISVGNFGEYTDLAEMAKNSVVFECTKDGQRVAEPVDAGTYNVKAYLPESKYWGYVEATGTFTIKKREVEITDVIAQAKTYDGDAAANVQTVELAQSEVDNTTGLPTVDTGIVEGDSVYVNAAAKFNSADVKEADTLILTSAVLRGPDAGNYTITNPKYSEEDTIARNQLAGSIVTSITAPTGYTLTNDDFYLIDQSGKRLTVAGGAHFTYYYHSGNDIAKAANTSRAGKYTVIVDAGDTANYKGGLTTTLYINPDAAAKTVEGSVEHTATSALIDITDTYYVYDGTAKVVTATATHSAAVTVEYAGADGQYTAAAPTDAGRYMVKATANGATAYGIMTIVKGEPGVTISAKDMEYDGTRYGRQTLNTAGTLYEANEQGDPYGELYYTYVGGSIVGYSYNAPIDVSYVPEDGAYVDSETSGAYGKYAVSAHVPETANTVADIVSAEFQITKADLTVSAQEVYTRLFDTNSKMTSTYEGFMDGTRGVDNSLRDFIAMPTYTIEGWDTDAMNEVGPFTLAVSDVNVRNYDVTYVNNQVVTNDQPTQAALELRHELGNENNENVVYYGQQFNVFLYGSRVDNQVNESSVVRYVSSDPSVATVDEKTGLVTVVGVGKFTITATRGDDETAISALETFEAEKRYNEIVIARDDYAYDGGEHENDKANVTYYYTENGTPVLNSGADADATYRKTTFTYTEQTQSGEHPVSAEINATYNTGTGKGVLAIHRVNSTVTPNADSTPYGTAKQPGTGYTAAPTVNNETTQTVLDKGVVAVDARSNSDVGGYEILVAGGKEGHNYNVAYAKSDADRDFDIKPKGGLTFSTGTRADAGMIGETENWREHDGVLAGSYAAALADKLTKDANRVFGERNYVLDYETAGLIDGDSFAELTEDGNGGRVDAFEWLHMGSDALEVEAAANRENADGKGTIGDAITSETGTIHGNGDATITETVDGETIDNTRYGITDDVITSGRVKNYTFNETASTDGTQNIYQRPVTMTAPEAGVLINAGAYTSEELAAAIANQLEIEGLATLLQHTYADLRLTVKGFGSGEQNVTSSTQKVTLVIGNTNYCNGEDGSAEIEIPITVADLKAHATVFDRTATSFKVCICTNGGAKLAYGADDFYIGVSRSNVFASETINIDSDRRVKDDIRYDLDDYEAFFRALKPCSYKLKRGTSGRRHTGFIAQELEQALLDSGKTSADLAAYCYDPDARRYENTDMDPKTAPTGCYKIRYSELIALNTAMIQKLMAEVDALKTHVAELEANNNG